MERRLAAILAADVVDYSRLIGEDEDRTLAALRSLRNELFGPAVAGHRGKLVKSMGDGWLVEFVSAVDAVNCAMRIQNQLAGHELIKLRIGIHIGDVVHEDEDVFGDGVNIAARLQEAAEPGALLISGFVHASLDGTLSPSFDEAGQRQLKNIARPVETWLRAPRQRPASDMDGTGTNPVADLGFPTLAIVPVSTSDTTSDNSAELRELADALSNDFATYLNASDWLSAVTVEQPGEQSYVLRSTLRARGQRLRLEIWLGLCDGTPVWKGKFDGDLDDSFDWQDATGEQITAEVVGQIFSKERQRLAQKSSEEMSAIECCLLGTLILYNHKIEDIPKGIANLQLAISKDPDLGLAYEWLAMFIRGIMTQGQGRLVEGYMPLLPQWLDEAERLAAPGSAAEFRVSWSRRLAAQEVSTLRGSVETAMREHPFDPVVLTMSGWFYVLVGEPEAAMDYFRKAEKLGRFAQLSHLNRAGHAIALIQTGRDDAAVEHAKKIVVAAPDLALAYRILAAALAQLGRQEEAESAAAKHSELVPDYSITGNRQWAVLGQDAATARYFDGLRLAGMPE
jgi:adenylate cyclase